MSSIGRTLLALVYTAMALPLLAYGALHAWAVGRVALDMVAEGRLSDLAALIFMGTVMLFVFIIWPWKIGGALGRAARGSRR